MITLNTEYQDFTGNLFVILIVKEDFPGESKLNCSWLGGGEGGIALKGGGGVDIPSFLQSVADMHFKPR